ncbi:MAG: single-stranded-DNA-specific exonuclease RecJ [Campylobacteraceae bacterium]|nr:single-stranded-DNA-specific exonuclease RecJ [Campylobacteraceae bacterium]
MQKITSEHLTALLEERHKNNPYAKLSNIPKPDSFKDIKIATKRVKEAITNKETITIVGDYDVDGIVSTTIMVDFFKTISYPINYIIPNRFKHGYGLSPKIVDQIEEGLVITVDNGISAYEASVLLKEKNIDLIITDHHTVGDKIPLALAIINTKQKDCNFPFKDICGAQIAWYFCAAIKKELDLNVDMSSFMDILCIAIIADIMPMNSLNYTMVKFGLQKFKNSKRPALLQLKQSLNKTVYTSDDVGFFIAPKLNSAGRLEDASIALEFLLSPDTFSAQNNLDYLNELNNQRKVLQNEINNQAVRQVNKNDKVIVVWNENWHEGVIGIVASKLCHAFKRPAFVFSITNGIAKGSARANSEINLHTLISTTSDLLLGFGGHKNAAGMALKEENLEEFRKNLNLNINNYDEELYINTKTLGELDVSSVSMDFLNVIERYEPYGQDNLKPIFTVSNANIIKKEIFGKDKSHLKLYLESFGFYYEAILFGETKLEGKSVSFIVSLNKNEFRGRCNTQFLIQEIL